MHDAVLCQEQPSKPNKRAKKSPSLTEEDTSLHNDPYPKYVKINIYFL